MKRIAPLLLLSFLCTVMLTVGSGCWVYSFNEKGTIPDSIKTVRVNFIENRAPYVNPQLSPALTDRVKQKIVNQTRLTHTSSDNAHYDISGSITDYSVSTSGVTTANGRQQSSINRLTVTVNLLVRNTLSNQEPKNVTVTRSFDFPSTQTLQTAESSLLDEMIRNLSDEIFNRIFSDW